jgi:PAS domain S-box-containing protein
MPPVDSADPTGPVEASQISSQRIAQLCAGSVFVAGLTFFTLRLAGFELLALPVSGLMQPHTLSSLFFALLSVPLWIHLRYPEKKFAAAALIASAGVALLCSVLALLWLLANALGHSWAETTAPGNLLRDVLRSHTLILLAVLPLSLGMCLLPKERRIQRRYGDWAALLSLFLVQAVFLRVILEPEFPGTYYALETVLLVALLDAAVLFAAPGPSLLSLRQRRGAGGVTLRRMLPAAFLLPTVLGVLRAYGEQIELYPSWLGILFSVVLTTLFFGGLVLFTASLLERMEQNTRKASRRLKEEQARFQSAFEHAAIGMCIVDLSGHFLEVNRALCEMLGYAEEALLTLHFQEITHPDDLAHDVAYLEKLLRGESSFYQIEKRYLHNDGRVVWAILSVSLIRDAEGKACYFISQVQDITERELAQEALHKSCNELARAKSLLESTLNSTGDYIAAVDVDLALLAFNEAFAEEFEVIFGKTPQLGKSLPGHLAGFPEDQDNVTRLLKQALETGPFVSENTLGDPARTKRTYEFVLGSILDEAGAAVGVSFIGRDVSERRRHEQDLERREEHFRTLLELAPDGMLVVDAAGIICLVNTRTEALFGYTREELIGNNVSMLLPVSSQRGYPALLAWALQQEGVHHLGEVERVRGLRRAGDEFPVEVSISPIIIEEDRRLIAAIRDISERSRMLTALTKSEEHLQIALESARVGIWSWDPSAGALTWDSHMGPLFGLPPGSQPTNYEESMALVHPEDRAAYVQEAIASLASKEFFDERFRVIHPDGTIRWLASHARVWRDDEGNPKRLAGACWDVSEEQRHALALQRAAEELARSNKDLQQFAYAASHDLQEPLRAVAGCAQILQLRYNDLLDDEGRAVIRHTVDGARRMQTLIEDLLAYSRVGTRDMQLHPVCAEEPAREAMLNLEVAITESAAQIWVEPLPTVIADSGQLRQLFQNLLANAIKFRGTDPPRIVLSATREEDAWLFHVADNGIGIDPSHSARVFQVFQRLHTRGTYPGTGIGLAICKRIVERHGGQIGFQSELGAGATFHFSIPDAPEQEPA